MHPGLTNLIIAIACFILIILLVLLYARSRQGDQRIIRVTNQMLLPLLSAILITLGALFNNQGNAACTGALSYLKYLVTFGAILIILVGVVRFLLSRNRDRRLITHAVLFAIMIVLAAFAIQEIFGCM